MKNKSLNCLLGIRGKKDRMHVELYLIFANELIRGDATSDY